MTSVPPLRLSLICLCVAGGPALAGCGDGSSGAVEVGQIEVADAGLSAPRAVVYDSEDDVYLVSNMNGGPLDRDENGFISRVSPEGEVLSQQWSPPLGSGDRIHAPKGMAIRGDSVFVADVQCIRILSRVTGELVDSRCLDVTSLNGLDLGPEGSIFVTDSGFDLVDGETVPSSTDAIYRLAFQEGRQEATVASGPDLNHPTGLAIGSRGIFVTTAGGDLFRFTAEGERTPLLEVPDQVFEGVVFVAGGGFAYSSSAESRVYLVDESGAVSPLVEDIGPPGDLGYDSSRNRLLIAIPGEDRLVFVDL